MNPANRSLKNKIRIIILLLSIVLVAGTAFAIDQPPQEPDQQRAWLVGHLVTDMEALGTFDGNALAKVPGIVDALTDDQVALLAQYYYLTRSKTEQDASLYSLQQQGYADEQVNVAKAQIADLLTELNDQTVACYSEFVPMPQPVQFVSYIVYASVPGWCCHARCFVPEWYYDNGCYVGPCFNAAYAGIWGVPVCRAYYDRGSQFYGRYHNVANAVYINRSINLAHRRADWYRHQGDWRNVLAHDRLLRQSAAGNQHQPQVVVGKQNHAGARNSVAQAYRPPATLGGQQQFNKAVARHQKPSHASVARQPKAQHKAGKARQAPASHPKVQRAAKPHVSTAHAHAPRPAPHAGHPKPAAHAPRPQHAAHAQPHPQHAAQRTPVMHGTNRRQ